MGFDQRWVMSDTVIAVCLDLCFVFYSKCEIKSALIGLVPHREKGPKGTHNCVMRT